MGTIRATYLQYHKIYSKIRLYTERITILAYMSICPIDYDL